jgi:putative membrane protein
MGGGMGGGGLLFGVAGFICTLLVIGLITAFVLFLVKRSKQGPGPHRQHGRPPSAPFLPPALQLLDERLARGEIDVPDYLERKAAMLGEHPRPTEWTATESPSQPTEPPKDDGPGI